jgi:hypothetical protein
VEERKDDAPVCGGHGRNAAASSGSGGRKRARHGPERNRAPEPARVLPPRFTQTSSTLIEEERSALGGLQRFGRLARPTRRADLVKDRAGSLDEAPPLGHVVGEGKLAEREQRLP